MTMKVKKKPRGMTPTLPKQEKPTKGFSQEEEMNFLDHRKHAPVSPVTGTEYESSDVCPMFEDYDEDRSLSQSFRNMFGCRMGFRIERA